MKKVLFPFHKTCNSLFNENEPKLCLGYYSCVSLAIDYMITCPKQNFKTSGRRRIMSNKTAEGRITQRADYRLDQQSR